MTSFNVRVEKHARANVNVTKLISTALFCVNVEDTVLKSIKKNTRIMQYYSENPVL